MEENGIRIDVALNTAYDLIEKNGNVMEARELTALLKEIAALEKAKTERNVAECECFDNGERLRKEFEYKDKELDLRFKELDAKLKDLDIKRDELKLRESEIITNHEMRKEELKIRKEENGLNDYAKHKECYFKDEELCLKKEEIKVKQQQDKVSIIFRVAEFVGGGLTVVAGVFATEWAIKSIMDYEKAGEIFASAAKAMIPKIKI